MFIGYDFFGLDDGVVFDNVLSHRKYDNIEVYEGIIDQLYIDEDVTIPYTTEKFDGWRYNTVVNAKLDGSLEAGSVQAGGLQIERVRFQKRRWDELKWHDVAELEYIPERNVYYEAIDKNVANEFEYEYSLLPVTATIFGNRITTDSIQAKFSGVFLSDIRHNYKLIYDVDISEIESVMSNSVFEPLNSKYPIVVHSNLDYGKFDVRATFLSTDTEKDGKINIRMERLGKDKLMEFMKNGQPKMYRDHLGNAKIVAVVGNPKEIPNNNIDGLSSLSFSLVEIADFTGEGLRESNLLEGLVEVF